MKLSTKQINVFNDEGFLILKKFSKPELCDAILKKAKEHLDNKESPFELEIEQEYSQTVADSPTIRRLCQVYDRDDIFSQWMRNKTILPILTQLLKEAPILLLAHHNSIMTKHSIMSTATAWHQDIRYWNYENDKLISVWLSLGNETIDNGLLEFIPSSHKMRFDQEQFDKNSTFRKDLEKNKKIIAKRVHYNLEKGDVVIFHAKTLHSSQKNHTENIKFSFVYSLRATSNLPIKKTRSDFKEVVL